MLSYPAAIPLSTASLTHLSQLLRTDRTARGVRWRRLDPGRQALLVLAHLRNGDTYARLGAGFGISTTTAFRYIREALALLAAQAPTLDQVVYRASRLLYLILDGTLIPIDRIAEDRPYYSGKHKRHGVNVQVLADTRGRLLWVSAALPGAVHDVRAARHHGIPAALCKFGVAAYADAAYQAAGPTIAVPYRRHPKPLSRNQKTRQPQPRPQPGTRRTRHRHPQNLAATDQTALLPTPRHHDHRRNPGPPDHRRPGQTRMKNAQCVPASRAAGRTRRYGISSSTLRDGGRHSCFAWCPC